MAVSHASARATEQWVVEVGGEWEVEVVVDEERELYRAWGLGETGAWFEWNPRVWLTKYRIGRDEGIWGTGDLHPDHREVEEGGTRWQLGGAFAVDASGFVRW